MGGASLGPDVRAASMASSRERSEMPGSRLSKLHVVTYREHVYPPERAEREDFPISGDDIVRATLDGHSRSRLSGSFAAPSMNPGLVKSRCTAPMSESLSVS